jgi:hypothetical protein
MSERSIGSFLAWTFFGILPKKPVDQTQIPDVETDIVDHFNTVASADFPKKKKTKEK